MYDQKAEESTTYVEKMQYSLAACIRIFYISEQEIRKIKNYPTNRAKSCSL